MRFVRALGLVLLWSGAALAQVQPGAAPPPAAADTTPAAASDTTPPPSLGAANPSATSSPSGTPAPLALPPPPDRAEIQRMIERALEQHDEQQAGAARAWTVRRHDGPYVRLGLDVAYSLDRAEEGNSVTNSRGLGSFIEFNYGANVSESFVLGLGFHTVGIFSPTTEVDGQPYTPEHTAFYGVFGLLLDYFPDPKRGLHVSFMFGSGSADILVKNDEPTDSGIGMAFGVGYDFWVLEQWSMGPSAQLLIISNAEDDFGRHEAYLPTLGLTALLH